MVLPVKKMLAITLCVSTFATLNVVQIEALHPHPRRILGGIHHTTQYAPKVVKQLEDTPEQEEDSESSDSFDSHEEGDIKLAALDELDISSSQDLDLDVDGAANVNIVLADGEALDYDGNGAQTLDISSSHELDFSADVCIDGSCEMDTDMEFTDGIVDVELANDEAYTQDLEFQSNELIDEVIDVPEGAKSIHLRVHNGNVDLDVIKGATRSSTIEAQLEHEVVDLSKEPKKEVKKEKKNEEMKTMKKEDKTVDATAQEVAVSYAAEAKNWIGENAGKHALLGGIIGAAVGIIGIAGIAFFKSRQRASDPAEDAPADIEAEIELNDFESESDDEDVEAGVTALAEEKAEEDKKTSVVEGSV